jgi:antirestriction protein ArdC
MAKKVDFQQVITDQFVAGLEQDTPVWFKPWTTPGFSGGEHTNPDGVAYQGMNQMLCWAMAAAHGYSGQRWFTWNRIKQLGASVEEGKTKEYVFLTKWGQYVKNKGKPDEKAGMYMKTFHVYNEDVIEGLPAEFVTPVAEPQEAAERDEACEAFFASTGAVLLPSAQSGAFYMASKDVIGMPAAESFTDMGEYYGTLYHELGHWTGHKTRLDRWTDGARSTEDYAEEELVAEIFAAFCCAYTGATPDMEQSKAYVKGWLKKLQDDKRFIFRAASKAGKAFEFVKAAQEEMEAKQAA